MIFISVAIAITLAVTSAASETTGSANRALSWQPDCKWKGIGYEEGDRAYDCNAKYDYCECECDWSQWSSKCYWSNCGYDWSYCNVPKPTPKPNIYNEYTNAVCWRKRDREGKKGRDYFKYTLHYDNCKQICTLNSDCKAFHHNSDSDRCEIWVRSVNYVHTNNWYPRGSVCYTKIGATPFSAEPEDPDADENGIVVIVTNTTEPLNITDEPDSPTGPVTPIEDSLSDADTEPELIADPEADVAANGDSTSSAINVNAKARNFACSAGFASLGILLNIF